MGELLADDPFAIFFNCDDRGDIAGIHRLVEAAQYKRTRSFVAAVYNAPEPDTQRVGTPMEVVEASDVTLLSPVRLGRFYADALNLAASTNPDLRLFD